ncbi:hypothetical protein Tco_0870980 [Tanacetum coccineum]
MLSSPTGLFSFQFRSVDGLDVMLENVKLHGVLVMVFSKDGLSAIATKLGTPLILDTYTSDMCLQSWGMSSYARAMIELLANMELKDTIVVAFPKLTKEGMSQEYWLGEAKYIKRPSQAPRGVSVCPKVGFKPAKQVFRPASKNPTSNTSRNKKKDVEPTKKVSNSNAFDVLNSVENDVDLGTNGRDFKSG